MISAQQDDSDPGSQRKLIAAVALLVVAGAIATYSLAGGSRSVSLEDAKAFYTVDNGVTTYTDQASLAPPFDHNGKQAVQAIVFTTDGGKTKTVGYLQRYSAETKKAIAANPKTTPTANGIEVSKPGPTPTWAPANSAAGMAIIRAATPTGANVEQVTP